jgi:hypothetical protein
LSLPAPTAVKSDIAKVFLLPTRESTFAAEVDEVDRWFQSER